jgi:hypothetical protein
MMMKYFKKVSGNLGSNNQYFIIVELFICVQEYIATL